MKMATRSVSDAARPGAGIRGTGRGLRCGAEPWPIARCCRGLDAAFAGLIWAAPVFYHAAQNDKIQQNPTSHAADLLRRGELLDLGIVNDAQRSGSRGAPAPHRLRRRGSSFSMGNAAGVETHVNRAGGNRNRTTKRWFSSMAEWRNWQTHGT